MKTYYLNENVNGELSLFLKEDEIDKEIAILSGKDLIQLFHVILTYLAR